MVVMRVCVFTLCAMLTVIASFAFAPSARAAEGATAAAPPAPQKIQRAQPLSQDCAQGFRKIRTDEAGIVCTLDLERACPTFTRYHSGAWNGDHTATYRCEVPPSMRGSIEQDPDFNPTCPDGASMGDGASGVVCQTPRPATCKKAENFMRGVGLHRGESPVPIYNCDGRPFKKRINLLSHRIY